MVTCNKNNKKRNVHLPLKRRDIWAINKNILSTRVLKSLWFRHVQGQDISRVHCNLNFKIIKNVKILVYVRSLTGKMTLIKREKVKSSEVIYLQNLDTFVSRPKSTK